LGTEWRGSVSAIYIFYSNPVFERIVWWHCNLADETHRQCVDFFLVIVENTLVNLSNYSIKAWI